ncbi:MAG: hypothetical protein NC923_03660 [Candidatus Omnitrophica bacterium]|nr:hypothetical protein [Candidatus Omnitrophota bacterium]
MKKIIIAMLSLIFCLAIGGSAFFCLATTISLDTDDPEEAAIILNIRQSANENELCGYLTHNSSRIRIEAARRLGDVGSMFAINRAAVSLLQLSNSDPEQEVRDEADFSIWKIRYRLALATNNVLAINAALLQTLGQDLLADEPKRPLAARIWALELLADMGSPDALIRIEKVLAAETLWPPYILRLKQICEEAQKIIAFINPNKARVTELTISEELIEQALIDSELCIRKWGVRSLIKRNPPDLIERLNELADKTRNDSEDDFSSYIDSMVKEIEERKQKESLLPIEFISPSDGATVETKIAVVMGFSFGKLFVDHVPLQFGLNTFTKNVTGPDGRNYSATLRLNYNNHPPVLTPIGNKNVSTGSRLAFIVNATDMEGRDDLIYYADELPEGAQFDTATRAFVWTPSTAGNYSVLFGVVDHAGEIDEERINITVNPSSPAAPDQLEATIEATNQINLSWRDNSSNETGFILERKTSGGNWSTLTTVPLPANATLYSDNTVSVNNTYTYRVQAVNQWVASAYSNEVTKSIIVPTAPNNLTVVSASGNQVYLSWNDTSTDETGFKIMRRTGNNGPWSQIGSAPANTTTYIDDSISYDTVYYYVIQAAYEGISSANSNEVYVVIFNRAPIASHATPIAANQIKVEWLDTTASETNFVIERKTGSSGTYTELFRTSANTIYYFDTNISLGNVYFYRIKAINGPYVSGYSQEMTAHCILPAAPSGLSANLVSATQVDLYWEWSSSAPNLTSFKLERKVSSAGTWSEIATISSSDRLYHDSGPASNTTYHYRIKAVNVLGSSPYSNEATITISPPSAPSGLTATAASTTQVTLRWADNSNNESGFTLERKEPGGTYAARISLSPNVTVFNDTAAADKKYYYRIKATNPVGDSAYSAEAEVSTFTPAAPTNLNALLISLSPPVVKLTWADNANNEKGFRIQRKEGIASQPGIFVDIAVVGQNVTEYTDQGGSLNQNKYYTYQVQAINDDITSAPISIIVCTLTNVVPKNLTTYVASVSQINLSWTCNLDIETGFSIERKVGSQGIWREVAQLPTDATSYADTNLTVNTVYYYRVRPLRTGIIIGYSNEVAGVTATPDTGNVLLAAYTDNETYINLSWLNLNSLFGSIAGGLLPGASVWFKVERSVNRVIYSEIATVQASTNSYRDDTGLSANTTYYYRIRAVNGALQSPTYSNVAIASTAIPLAPSGLTTTAISASRITLNWVDNSNNETGFRIERAVMSNDSLSEYQIIATTAANVRSYTNVGLNSKTTYYYRVRAVRYGSYSDYVEISVTTP